MTTEAALYDWLKPAHSSGCVQLSRVENYVLAGMADVEGFAASGACQFWLELKVVKRPARPTTPLRFDFRDREKQTAWMTERWRLGGNAFYLLCVGQASERRLYLAAGDLGDVLKMPIHESELAVLCATRGEVFPARIKPADLIGRVTLCRQKLSLMRSSRSLSF